MNGYINPAAYLLVNPKGLDKHIQDMQTTLQAKLPWLQVAFGRAFRQEGTTPVSTPEGKTLNLRYFFPEVYQQNKEPLNAMPNDSLQSVCFFYSRDPGRPVSYSFINANTYVYPVSLIFWVDLQKIDPTKDFRFTEELKLQVLEVLKGLNKVEVTAIYEQWENVLADFTIAGNFKQYLKPPHSGFRIDFNLAFTDLKEGC